MKEMKNIREICKENNLPYTMITNLIEPNSKDNQIQATLTIIKNLLVSTLGPYGGNVLIKKTDGINNTELFTKDGLDVIKHLNFDNDLARTVLNLIYSIASSQAISVGDGTTSSIVAASALYDTLTNSNQIEDIKKIPPKDKCDILRDISTFAGSKISALAKQIPDDFTGVDSIAAISLNNDDKAGKLIKDIYSEIGRYGFITTDTKKNILEDTYEISNGITWGRGAIDSVFTDLYPNKRIQYTSPKVIIFDYDLTFKDVELIIIPLFKKAMNSETSKLVIVANGYDEDVKNFFKSNRVAYKTNRNTAELDFTPVDIDQVTETSRSILKNLAILAKCEIVTKATPTGNLIAYADNYIGRADKAIITKKNTDIVFDKNEDNPARDAKIAEIKEELKKYESLSPSEKTSDIQITVYNLRQSLSQLTSSSATIHVGGGTLAERESRERLFEDAVLSTSQSLKHGYIYGGLLSIPNVLLANTEELTVILANKYKHLNIENINIFFMYLIEEVAKAFLEVYYNVLANGYIEDPHMIIAECINNGKIYNLKHHKYEKLDETSIINPSNLDEEIIKTTVSIVTLLFSTEYFMMSNLQASEAIEPKTNLNE